MKRRERERASVAEAELAARLLMQSGGDMPVYAALAEARRLARTRAKIIPNG